MRSGARKNTGEGSGSAGERARRRAPTLTAVARHQAATTAPAQGQRHRRRVGPVEGDDKAVPPDLAKHMSGPCNDHVHTCISMHNILLWNVVQTPATHNAPHHGFKPIAFTSPHTEFHRVGWVGAENVVRFGAMCGPCGGRFALLTVACHVRTGPHAHESGTSRDHSQAARTQKAWQNHPRPQHTNYWGTPHTGTVQHIPVRMSISGCEGTQLVWNPKNMKKPRRATNLNTYNG